MTIMAGSIFAGFVILLAGATVYYIIWLVSGYTDRVYSKRQSCIPPPSLTPEEIVWNEYQTALIKLRTELEVVNSEIRKYLLEDNKEYMIRELQTKQDKLETKVNLFILAAPPRLPHTYR